MSNGTVITVDGHPVLRFERRLRHSPEKVWRAMTEPDQVRNWFPADIHGEWKAGAPLHFEFRENEGPTLEGEVKEIDPPRLLEFTWDQDVFRYELEPDGDGCRLAFVNVIADPTMLKKVAPGWHICLDALSDVLDGKPQKARAEIVEQTNAMEARYADITG